MNKLRCAIIGCGRIGCGFDDKPSKIIKTHAGAYFNNPQTKLVALCDIDKKKLEKYGKKYDVTNLFTDYKEMLKTQNLDCVSICTLSDTHLELVRESSKYGVKGIFLEKPISDSLKDAKKISQICKKKKISLQIDHQRRFHPIYHFVKDLVNQKKIGVIQFIDVYYGAGIANTGSHMFDLLRFLFGEVKTVQSFFSKNESGNLSDPNLDIIIKFDDSTICKINALDYRNYAVFEMCIFGSNGTMKLDLIKNVIQYSDISTKSKVYKTLKSPKIIAQRLKKSPIELGLKDLVSSILYNKQTISSGKEGINDLELIVASIKSARTKKKINLPINTYNYKVYSK